MKPTGKKNTLVPPTILRHMQVLNKDGIENVFRNHCCLLEAQTEVLVVIKM